MASTDSREQVFRLGHGGREHGRQSQARAGDRELVWEIEEKHTRLRVSLHQESAQRRRRHRAADRMETSSVSPTRFGRFLPVSIRASTSFPIVEIVSLFCTISPH